MIADEQLTEWDNHFMVRSDAEAHVIHLLIAEVRELQSRLKTAIYDDAVHRGNSQRAARKSAEAEVQRLREGIESIRDEMLGTEQAGASLVGRSWVVRARKRLLDGAS